MKIISVTGTKGKTTIVRALDHVIGNMGIKTLRVDTDGHYIKGKQQSTCDDSRNLFRKRPTVCPGKYLMSMKNHFPKFACIFETSLGCSGKQGRGYSRHNIGVFANIYEDHIGEGKYKKKKDLAKAKNFIFKAIDENGTAVFNADDKYVCGELKTLPKKRAVKVLPIGFDFKHFAIKTHLNNGGKCITVEDDFIILKTKNSREKLANVNNFLWTFKGEYRPSTYNLMLIIATLYVHFKKEKLPKAIKLLGKYKFDKNGGRLVKLISKKGAKIIVDYAHEKYSLLEIARLANALKTNESFGIIRLAPNRTDKLIKNTGRAIANQFDNIIVYDKIDGVTVKEDKTKNEKFKRIAGETSKILYKAIKSKQENNVQRIIVEEDAIKKVAEKAGKGDVVVIISNEDHKKSVNLVKKHFNAKFI